MSDDTFGRFWDAAVVAREIHRKLIQDDGNPVDVFRLIPLISSYRQKESSLAQFSIKVFELDAGCSDDLRGNIRVNRMSLDSAIATIWIVDDSNCRKRFVLCKELMHVYFDVIPESGAATIDAVRQLRKLVASHVLALGRRPDFGAIDLTSEEFCYVLAIEILLPFYQRPKLDKMIESGATTYEVADHFKVPEYIAELFMKTNYRELSQKVHEELAESESKRGLPEYPPE